MSTAIESIDQTATADTTPAEITPWAPGDSIKVITASEGYELLLANPHALYVGETITDNTRQTVVEDETFSNDIKEFGVDVVIEARRDEQGVIRVHDGKMRTLAARKAGMDEVLVLIRPNDNDDERDATVKRIFSQLRINERRSDISNADKLAALHQLVLLNVTPKEIASQRHMPLKEAKKLYKAVSSKAAVKAAQAAEHELTLDQLLVFEEHKDDEDALATLTEVAKTYPRSLANKSSELRQKRRDADLLTAQQDKLAKSGTPIVTDEELADDNLSAELTELRPSPGHEPGTPLTVAAHKNCPGNAARIEFVGHGTDRKAVQVPLCRDFRTFGHAQLDAPTGVASIKPAGKMTPEELAERRVTIKFNKEWPLSVEARRAFMLETFRGNTYPQGFRIHRRIAQLHLAAGHEFKRADERGHQLLRQCLVSKAETGNGTQRQADHASVQKLIDGASEERAAMITLGFWAFAVDENHSRRKDGWKARSPELVLLMTLLKELGKELTEVENYILGLDEQGNPLDGPMDPAATSNQFESPDSTGSAEPAAA